MPMTCRFVTVRSGACTSITSPIGFAAGHKRVASAWLIMATGGPEALSVSLNDRPPTIDISMSCM
jgi:hypothetical protein